MSSTLQAPRSAPSTPHAAPADDGGWARPTAPDTLQLQRLLPGPIERAWAFIADSDLRRQWLAAGDLPARPGQRFELVWRNDELSEGGAAERPEGFDAESRGSCELLACEPPHHLRFDWQGLGEVSIDLRPAGDRVLLTLVHRRLPAPATAKVSAGWHQHLDILVARAEGRPAPSLWSGWKRLHAAYVARAGA